jgi:class 3 adenylate cyclase
MKRKISAILAADVAGYSKLIAEDEEDTLRRLAAYRAVFEDFVTQRGGRIFSTAGDAVLAEFPSAVEAVRCAVDVQESVRTRNMAYPASRQMLFRIGLSIGDVVERDGDLLGDGVNIAARLQTLATPGGLCVSRSVYEQVANKLSLSFADAGPQSLKNIPTPIHAYKVSFTPEKAKTAGPKRSLVAGAAIVVAAFVIVISAVALRQRQAEQAERTQAPSPATAVAATAPASPAAGTKDDAVAVPDQQLAAKAGASPPPNSDAERVAAAPAFPAATSAAPPSLSDAEFSWNLVRDSRDEVALQSFIDRFPTGSFAELARHRLADLREEDRKRTETKPASSSPPPAAEPPQTAAAGAQPAAPSSPSSVIAAAAPPVDTRTGPTAISPSPSADTVPLAKALQRELKRLGCFDADSDGIWGQKSRVAIKNFARHAKLMIDNDEPSVAVLDAALAAKDRACPLSCAGDQNVVDGRCVDKPRRVRHEAGREPRRPAPRAERRHEEQPSRPPAQGRVCFGPARNEIVPCQ